MIEITKINDHEFEVRVSAATPTVHQVTLNQEYYHTLTGGNVSKEELLKMSFGFLLERESNTMIFREFELPVISRYFPEYESVIKEQVKK